VEFEIAGVVNFQPETSSAAGSAAFFVIDRPLYLKLWGDGRVDRMRLALAPGADPAAVRRDLLRSFAEAGILAVDHSALRAAAKSPGFAFGAMAYGLLPFMMLGIANTLFIAVLDRRREIGLLRALGVLRGQIAASIVLEVLIVIGISCLVGIPAAYYMVDVMLYGRIVGVPIRPDTAGLVIVAAGTLMAGILAAYLPARQAARLDVLDALHYE